MRKGQPLYKTLPIYPKVYRQYIFDLQNEDGLLQGTKWVVPKCPLLRGSTVHVHVLLYMLLKIDSILVLHTELILLRVQKCVYM